MSARTRITTRAAPGFTAAMRMPSAWLARSRSNSAAAARSARLWAPGSLCWFITHSRSTAAEARGALGGKRRHTLSIVGAAAQLALEVALDIQLLLER